jgi:diguanylate cyclase (GGDEF)-like protein
MTSGGPTLASPIGRRMLRLIVPAALSPVVIAAAAIYPYLAPHRDPAPQHGLWLPSLVLIATLVMAAWAVRHIHRLTAGLNHLLAALRGIGVRPTPPLLPPEHGAEMPELARAFNDMARNLAVGHATQGILSHIDRTILTTLDIEEIARSVMRCLRRLTGAEVAAVGLYETASADALTVYVMRGRSRDPLERLDVPAERGLLAGMPAQPVARWQGELPLPKAVATRLQSDASMRAYSVLPVAGQDRVWGVVVLCHRDVLAPAAEHLALAGELTARLQIACSVRDRNRRLQAQAHADALTGLPNRHALLALLANELEHAARKKARVGVLFLDLDRFKPVNDTLGHAAGDTLLRYAAERIKHSVRDDDTVARHGGDEFAVVLGNLGSARDSGTVARQLIRALSRPYEIEGQTVYVGASAGIAVFPDDGTEPEDLLKKADTAMYRAKDAGRSRFAYFEERMNVEARHRAALDAELRQALERNEFVLHYQPQIDLRTGQVCTVEALVRWQHPVRGLLGPDTFVPFAEESGLIDVIGAWVMKEACLQHRRWRDRRVPIPRVAVNVSIGQLRRSNFVRTVQQAMNLGEMPHHGLEIEVTESMFLQSDKAAHDAIDALSKCGVLLAIDDFGAGYSSFGYLKTVPASVLKIDRSFIVDATTDNDAGTIVAAIVNMAHTLKKEVVAEGVETCEQVEFLRSLGCEKVQGYFFSRPLAADEVAQVMLERAGPDQFDLAAGTPVRTQQERPAPAEAAPASDEWLTVPFEGDLDFH